MLWWWVCGGSGAKRLALENDCRGKDGQPPITPTLRPVPPAAPAPRRAASLPAYHTRLRKDDLASVVRLRW